jgi:HEAT repeat protein
MMSGVPSSPPATRGPHGDASADERPEPSFALGPVSDMLKLFARAVRAHQLYLPNNPMHARALEAVRQAFGTVWAETDALQLMVTETSFECEGHPVLEEHSRGTDSLPWQFYKDGIRVLELRPEFEHDDLRMVLDAVQRVRQHNTEDGEDLLTIFWEMDFAHFAYRHVEVAAEGSVAPGAELLLGGAPSGGMIDAPSAVESHVPAPIGGSAAPVSSAPFARIDDYDTTLYFLDDNEINYLQQAIHDDFTSDLRPSVAAALLDTFEQEDEPAIRDEICGILEQFLLTLLSNMQFRTVAYLLRETSAAVERSASLQDEHRTRLVELADRMSEPAVLSQLTQALEDTTLPEPQDDLAELFAQLKPTALETLLLQIARSHNAALRTLMESAATRIASTNTAELLRLIGSDDDGVALEAVRRAGALRSPAAVVPLSKALGSPNPDLRRAAASALVDIGSAGAMQALERAVEDDDRNVRMLAVRAIAERQHRAALGRVERVLKERVMNEQHGPEKVAFFEAYASLAGDSCVAMLDGLLNPRGFLTRKEDTQTRACAAAALGKVGSTRALDALRKATNDKDIVVRNAASRALRGVIP